MNHDPHTLRHGRLKRTPTTVRLLAALATGTLVVGSLLGSAATAHADGSLASAPAPAPSSSPAEPASSSAAVPDPASSSTDTPDTASSSTDATGDGENLPAIQYPITLPVGNPLLTIDPSTLNQQAAAPDSDPTAADAPFIQAPAAATAPSQASADNSVASTGPTPKTPSEQSPTAVCECGGGDGTNATNVNVFVGVDRTQGKSSLDDSSPPDTQIAVSPTYVAEMVNSELRVYTRAGVTVGSPQDLTTLFKAGSNTVGNKTYNWPGTADPKILYDTASGRFFASDIVYNDRVRHGNGSIKIAVSAIDDPTQWGEPQIAVYTSGHDFLDQPKLAVNDDKITITSNLCGDYLFFGYGCGGNPIVSGGVTTVLDKAQVVAGTPLNVQVFKNDAFGSVPAIQLSPQERQYVYHYFKDSFGRSFLQEQYLTGTPALHNLKRITPPGLRIMDTTSPPSAKQPGTKVRLDTGDDSVESAVYRDGDVWTASNDKCKSLACLRLIQLSVDGLKKSQAPHKVQEVRYARTGLDAFYPAVTMDGNRDLIVSYSVSSPTMYASASETSLAASASFANVIPQDYEVGAGSLFGAGGGSPQRFGDYSGAAPDPILDGNVWVAGEWGAGIPSDTGRWSTAIGQYTFQPQIVEYN